MSCRWPCCCCEAARQTSDATTDALKDRSDDEKKASKEVRKGLFDVFEQTAKAGIFEMVVEVSTRASGHHPLVAGVRIPKGLKDRAWYVFETGGTTGIPRTSMRIISRLALPASRHRPMDSSPPASMRG